MYIQQSQLDFADLSQEKQQTQLSGWVSRYAIFPTKLTSGETIWFERYIEYHDYSISSYYETMPRTYTAPRILIAEKFSQRKLDGNPSNTIGCKIIKAL